MGVRAMTVTSEEPQNYCVYVSDHGAFQSSKLVFFLSFFAASRNSADFVPVCPDFYDVALGRTAHGLQTLLDAGSFCHFQQSTGKPHI